MDDFNPPNSYDLALARLRAAAATPESRSGDEAKAARLRELSSEPTLAALRTGRGAGPRFTAAELATYAPPDPVRSWPREDEEGAMTTAAPEVVLSGIERRLAALAVLDGKSPYERDAHAHERLALGRRSTAIRDALADIATLTPKIAAVETWIRHLAEWRPEFAKQLAALPTPADRRAVALGAAIEQIDYSCRIVHGECSRHPCAKRFVPCIHLVPRRSGFDRL